MLEIISATMKEPTNETRLPRKSKQEITAEAIAENKRLKAMLKAAGIIDPNTDI